ncbi:MAG: 30S ribosome-binding factor RbfA, partial [Nitrospirota bacterium]|nr:30S ribosome-binding factor RbfA [Nitrospirota bacterium]
LIKKEVADIIMNSIKHKDLGFITVTGAKLSDDLRHATVYISVLNTEDSERVLRKLNSAAGFVKTELAGRLTMRFVPKISFRIDESIGYGMKMDRMIDGLDKEKDERSDFEKDEDLF